MTPEAQMAAVARALSNRALAVNNVPDTMLQQQAGPAIEVNTALPAAAGGSGLPSRTPPSTKSTGSKKPLARQSSSHKK